MIVYRVEDKLELGLYRSNWDDVDTLCSDHEDEDHPTSDIENIICEFEKIHGFESIEKFESWFEMKWRKKLKSVGFTLNVYSINKRYVRGFGKKQIVFNLHKPKRLLKKLDLVSLKSIEKENV